MLKTKKIEEHTMLSIILAVQKNAFQLAQKHKQEHVKAEWREKQVKLMNALVGPSQISIHIEKSSEKTAFNATFDVRLC